MSVVARLVTLVDLRDDDLGGQMSFSARHEAVLEDGRHLLLLDDRGLEHIAPAYKSGL
jgi:hypothetical protein